MRSQRNQQWIIAEQENGSYEVWHGRRPVVTGMQDHDAALAIVMAHRRPGERVWIAEVDDYRTEITDRFSDQVTPPPTRKQYVKDPDDPTPARSRYLALYGGGRRSWRH